MKVNHRIRRAIKRVFEQRAQPEDKEIIDQWYNSFDSENQYIDEEKQLAKQRIFDQIRQQKTGSRRNFLRYTAAAAVLLVTGGIGYIYINQNVTSEIVDKGPALTEITGNDLNLIATAHQQNIKIVDQEIQAITAPKATLYSVVLEDNTRVWLNAGSSLRKVNFDKQQRQVELVGEAYFEVSKDSQRPFSIKTSQQTVTVLGTKFNLKSYPGQKEVLSLVEGSVRIVDLQQRSLILTAGQAAEIQPKKISKQMLKENNLVWRDQIFAFEDETLQEILDKVSNWYNVAIGPLPSSTHRYSGKIHTKADLQEVLNMLSLVSQKRITLENEKIIIK